MDGLSLDGIAGKVRAAALSEALIKSEALLESIGGEIDTRTTPAERAFLLHGQRMQPAQVG